MEIKGYGIPCGKSCNRSVTRSEERGQNPVFMSTEIPDRKNAEIKVQGVQKNVEKSRKH